nr:hypothetical protein [Candidatus Njordarchaeum guaymaensis]
MFNIEGRNQLVEFLTIVLGISPSECRHYLSPSNFARIDLESIRFGRLEQGWMSKRRDSFLSKLHEWIREAGAVVEKVWVTSRDGGFLSKYCNAIRNIGREFVVATPATRPAETEIVEAMEQALKNRRSVRIVGPITPQWTPGELDKYEQLIKLGNQVKYLEYSGMRFSVLDKSDAVVVWPGEASSQIAVWMNQSSLAKNLHQRFETLWREGEPALPVLRRLKEAKEYDRSKQMLQFNLERTLGEYKWSTGR